ncbi:MAG TPA: hypothetical protein VEZ14_03340 [Dehalococcoidia bacterium]|nr:hypothetical protein [Dehalococcoidia bacterium]
MTAEPYASYAVLAEYADLAGARRAIDALQFSGVEAGDIALLGAAAVAARRADTRTNMAARDTPLIWRILWRGFLWSIVGGVLGVALGLVFTFSGVDVFGGDNVALQVASWAMFFHVAGALWGAYAAISGGGAWEATFMAADVEGRVLLGVRAAPGADAARIARTLREKDALRVFGGASTGSPNQ